MLPTMKKLAEGTTLNGTGDESSVTLQVAGESNDGTRAFRAEVYAERTG